MQVKLLIVDDLYDPDDVSTSSSYGLQLTHCAPCYIAIVDCNRSGCDREGDIDWHMSYTVTVQSLNPTQSNPIYSLCSYDS